MRGRVFFVVASAFGVAAALGVACLPDYTFGSGGDAASMARLDPTDGGTFDFMLDLTGGGRTLVKGTLTRPFAIDKLEVTVGRYQAWSNSGQRRPCDGCSLDANGPYAAVMTWHEDYNSLLSPPVAQCPGGPAFYGPPSTLGLTDRPELPVTCVTWYAAAAFCASEGKRLATELEWMFAVTSRGKNHYFPWTASATPPLDCQHQIFDKDGDASTPGGNCGFLTAGPALEGGTDQGVLDMSGRVFEWIWDLGGIDFPSPPPANYSGPVENLDGGFDQTVPRVRRGGSFNSGTGDSRLENWYREKDFPGNEPYGDLGFRCAKSL